MSHRPIRQLLDPQRGVLELPPDRLQQHHQSSASSGQLPADVRYLPHDGGRLGRGDVQPRDHRVYPNRSAHQSAVRAMSHRPIRQLLDPQRGVLELPPDRLQQHHQSSASSGQLPADVRYLPHDGGRLGRGDVQPRDHRVYPNRSAQQSAVRAMSHRPIRQLLDPQRGVLELPPDRLQQHHQSSASSGQLPADVRYLPHDGGRLGRGDVQPRDHRVYPNRSAHQSAVRAMSHRPIRQLLDPQRGVLELPPDRLQQHHQSSASSGQLPADVRYLPHDGGRLGRGDVQPRDHRVYPNRSAQQSAVRAMSHRPIRQLLDPQRGVLELPPDRLQQHHQSSASSGQLPADVRYLPHDGGRLGRGDVQPRDHRVYPNRSAQQSAVRAMSHRPIRQLLDPQRGVLELPPDRLQQHHQSSASSGQLPADVRYLPHDGGRLGRGDVQPRDHRVYPNRSAQQSAVRAMSHRPIRQLLDPQRGVLELPPDRLQQHHQSSASSGQLPADVRYLPHDGGRLGRGDVQPRDHRVYPNRSAHQSAVRAMSHRPIRQLLDPQRGVLELPPDRLQQHHQSSASSGQLPADVRYLPHDGGRLGRGDFQPRDHRVYPNRSAHQSAVRAMSHRPIRQLLDPQRGVLELPPDRLQQHHQSQPSDRQLPAGLQPLSHDGSRLGRVDVQPRQYRLCAAWDSQHFSVHSVPQPHLRQLQHHQRGLHELPSDGLQRHHQSQPSGRQLPGKLRRLP